MNKSIDKPNKVVLAAYDKYLELFTAGQVDSMEGKTIPPDDTLYRLGEELSKINPSKKKLRTLCGFIKPVTRKAELKRFKKLRKGANENKGKIVLRKDGTVVGYNIRGKNNTDFPKGREAVRFVLSQADKLQIS